MPRNSTDSHKAVRLFAVLLLVASSSFALGEIQLTKGKVYTFTAADFSANNGEKSVPYVNSEGYSEASLSSKSVRSYSKAFLSGKSRYTASVGVQNRFRFGSGNEYQGKIRVTMSGIAYLGKVGTLGMGAASGWVRMIVRMDDRSIYSETSINRTEIMVLKVTQPAATGVTKTVDIPVLLKSGTVPILFVELRLDTAAATGTVAQVIPGDVISDFWNEGRGASYQQIKIEVIEALAPGGAMKPR